MSDEVTSVPVSDEATPIPVSDVEHARNARVRRNLLLLSSANWGLAVLAWTISAYLGITSPVRIIVYTVLFVVGLFAVAVAVASYVLEKFAHRPALDSPDSTAGGEQDTAAEPLD